MSWRFWLIMITGARIELRSPDGGGIKTYAGVLHPKQGYLSHLGIGMNNKKILQSRRLTLIASTLAHLRTELESPEQLASLLNAVVSPEWPTGEYDRDAMEFFRARLEEGGEAVEGWYGWYAVREADREGPRALVGGAGYFGPPGGPPGSEGTVEVGYSVLPQWQRRGYASEMVRTLVEHAFTFAEVERIIAHTTEANPASIAVLLRCGFHSVGAGQEIGTLRFERAHIARA
jgi:ribosomal-protein-alanine N-acetyltransferase